MFKGFQRDDTATMPLMLKPKDAISHHALDDAIEQALEFERLLELIKSKI